MKAMILAAGLGTRLRPLTDTHPKALVEINGRTLLEITLSRLRAFGVGEVIINVHHFADMIADYLKSKNNFGLRIEISREDDLLLDTGGGLKKAAWFFLEEGGEWRVASGEHLSEPFVLHNVDVLSNIDLRRMLQYHTEHRALATLAVQSRDSSRLLLFDDQLQLCGRCIRNEETLIPGHQKSVISSQARNLSSPPVGTSSRSSDASAERRYGPQGVSPLATRHSPLAFSGIHIISPRLLAMLSETGVFSIVDAYLRLAAQGEKILAFRADEYYWRDLGKPSDLSQAARDLQRAIVQ